MAIGKVSASDDPAANGGGPGERRRAGRRRILKAAIATFCDRHCTVSCMVRDLSATGARLKADATQVIPDHFELIIELDGLEAQCEVVWRRGLELGVRFTSPPQRGEPRRTQVLKAMLPEPPPTLRRRPPP